MHTTGNQRFPVLFTALLLLWLAVNLLQSNFTGILDDEAYYWMYAQQLDWGYFDHPPMVAFMIKAGNWLFKGETGTRLLTNLSQVFCIILIWITIDDQEINARKIIRFFGITASVVMFQLYGFITTPDAPLLLFTTLFLFAYQRFIQKENTTNILLLTLSMAGLIYSKYQGGIVILLVIISNLRLLYNIRFLIAGILGLVLLIPHFYWQFSNGLPSFRYHLVDRSKPFNIQYLLEYWPNQLAVFNPFFLGLTLYIFLKNKAADLFERALYFIVFGFLGFFWLTTLRGHAEPHWTIASSIAMIIFVYRKSAGNEKYSKYLNRFLYPSLFLLAFVRCAIAIDFLPVKLEFHHQKEWAESIEQKAGDVPVVFINSYQKPSVYTYYTGRPSFTLNNVDYRRNQFDLWNFEEKFHNKKVAISSWKGDSLAIPVPVPGKEMFYLHFSDSLQTVQRIKIEFDRPEKTNFINGDSVYIPVRIHNPYPYTIEFDHRQFPVRISSVFIHQKKSWIYPAIPAPAIRSILPGQTISTMVKFSIPKLETPQCQMGISLGAGIIREPINSNFVPITIH